ncbi:MAG TPA: acyl-CoA dehydrogenase family protein, partial [Acidimicrobiia bacterium]|nr:acyl-CoA dehydrogenase family protein [Acidimicrobiia bacterium]
MNLTFTEEQLALRAEVAAFLDEERAAGSFTPRVDAWITGFDRGFTKKMAARGWVGLTWPTRYGGGGRSQRGSGAIAEAVNVWKAVGHDDPARRDQLMKLWVAAEVNRLTNIRAGQMRKAGTPGPEG